MIIVMYILYSGNKNKKQSSIKIRPIIISLIVGILGVYIFATRIMERGVQFDIITLRPDVNYDFNGWVSILFPFLAWIVFILYGYFGFGFFYISTYVKDIWFSSIENFISGFIPMGHYLIIGESISDIIKTEINMGARWHPDAIIFVDNGGYIGLLMLCFILGILSKYITTIEPDNPFSKLTDYIILIQMISLPVGNFIFTSSANQLTVLLLFIYWLWRIFINKKIVINPRANNNRL